MTEMTLLTGLFLGFLLGVRHALDADHVVAVTTIVSRSRSILRALVAGLSWGMGHTFTILAAGTIVLVFNLTIPDKLVLSAEFAIGLILVLLGVPLVKQLVSKKAHIHLHEHEAKQHLHPHSHEAAPNHRHQHIRRPLLIGMAHGLAGSGALTVLVLGTMPSVAYGVFFLLLFGIGSILGMVIFSGVISFPFKLTARVSPRFNLWIQGIAGLASIALGLFILWETGFASGLLLPVA
ncbi:MAG: sulfite exporter TauE/SafE family protein [Chloroflexi bacterium]|nr:sulfite exporter TauE/SafE family protein [Chloroflexota bacterium]